MNHAGITESGVIGICDAQILQLTVVQEPFSTRFLDS